MESTIKRCCVRIILVLIFMEIVYNNGLFLDKARVEGPSKAYSILPNSTEHLEFLHSIKNLSHELQLIWKDNLILGESADVIVSHEDQRRFETLLQKYKLAYTITADNVEKLIYEEAEQNNFKERRLADSVESRSRFKTYYDINRYHSYEDMVSYMNYLKWRYHYIVDIIDLGTTYEGRKIKTIKIGYPLEDSKKRAIWIDAGTHAREWASHSTAMYFIKLLTTEYDSNPEIQQYVTNFTWYITPVLNPDGYEYSRSIKTVKVRFWRKNRSKRPEYCSEKQCCVGVDLNRNYDFFWNAFSNSRHPCTEDYRGPVAFSENETVAVRNFMFKHWGEMDAYITLHTYSQFWVYPYGHKASVYPKDVDDLKSVALNATKALKKLHGTVYRVGSGADLLYSAAGGSEDWIKAKMKIKYSYLLELRPKDTAYGGFSMPSRYLRPIGEETWAGVKVVADAVYKFNKEKARKS